MKSYHQFCGVAKALDLIGDRWTLLITRDLLIGAQRFGELEGNLGGIPPATLADRLHRLTENGLVEVVGTGRNRAYRLTPEGARLEPVVFALGAFGAHYMTFPSEGERANPRWAMVSFKRRFRLAKNDWDLVLDCAGQAFRIRFGRDGIQIEDYPAPSFAPPTTEPGPTECASGPDTYISGTSQGFGPLILKRSSVDELLKSSLLVCDGNPQALRDLMDALD